MTRISLIVAALMSWLVAAQPGFSQTAPGQGGVEKLYVLYCGDIALTDASSFTPGASGPGALSVTCYLIKHGRDWVLFDTGLPDATAAMPAGQPSGPQSSWR